MKKIIVIANKYSGVWAALMALLSVILYATGYLICEMLYPNPEDIAKWRFMRDTLGGLVYLLLIWTYALPKSAISKAAIYAFMVLAMGDMLDRWFFRVSSYQWNDTIVIIGAIVVFFKIYKRNVSKPLQ